MLFRYEWRFLIVFNTNLIKPPPLSRRLRASVAVIPRIVPFFILIVIVTKDVIV